MPHIQAYLDLSESIALCAYFSWLMIGSASWCRRRVIYRYSDFQYGLEKPTIIADVEKVDLRVCRQYD